MRYELVLRLLQTGYGQISNRSMFDLRGQWASQNTVVASFLLLIFTWHWRLLDLGAKRFSDVLLRTDIKAAES